MIDKEKLILLLKDGQVNGAVALLNLAAASSIPSAFDKAVRFLAADPDFLEEMIRCDFVEAADYLVTRGFCTVEKLKNIANSVKGDVPLYTCALLSALERPRWPKLTPANRLGPAVVAAYIAMHLHLAHKWPWLHVSVIALFIGTSILTWHKSGQHTSHIAALRNNPSPLATARCHHCRLPMRPGSRWRSKQVHCRYCNMCVDGFDHHCFWLGCCINEKNYHAFILALVSAICMYLLGLVDGAVYYYQRPRIPVYERIGLSVQFACYVFFFIALLMHVNKRRYSVAYFHV